MKWSAEYSTGVQRLDRQHKMLFKMSEDFRAALDEGRGEQVYGVLLKSLAAYARGHFGFEEECMHRYRCPAAEKNRLAHAQFIEIVAEFQQRYAVRRFERSDAQRLVEFLDQWLVDHICCIDAQLKPYVKPPQGHSPV